MICKSVAGYSAVISQGFKDNLNTTVNLSFSHNIYFNCASTSPLAACSVNNKVSEEEAIIKK